MTHVRPPTASACLSCARQEAGRFGLLSAFFLFVVCSPGCRQVVEAVGLLFAAVQRAMRDKAQVLGVPTEFLGDEQSGHGNHP